jgi:hypothetical protein
MLRIGLQQAQPHCPIDLPVEVGEASIGGGYMVVDPLVGVEPMSQILRIGAKQQAELGC